MGLRGRKEHVAEECVMRHFMISAAHQILVIKSRMVRCVGHVAGRRGQEICIQGFGRKI